MAFMFDTSLFEVRRDSADDLDDDSLQMEDPSTAGDIDSLELKHFKKYYLLEKLQNLQSKLKRYNLYNEFLDILLKFAPSMSYDILFQMSKKVVKSVEEQLLTKDK